MQMQQVINADNGQEMNVISDTVKSDSLAIVGMCKNAGKTTVLNALIPNMTSMILGLTSIGRDGEAVDVATSTPKPDVYVREGTIFATAREMLPLCDVTLEILDTTGISTALGEVVIARARSDGNIQIAGPSTVDGLRRVYKCMKDFGSDRIIFDGAISRKSLSIPTLCDEIILCSGASYSRSLSETVRDTAFISELFCLDENKTDFPVGKFVFCTGDRTEVFEELLGLKDFLRKERTQGHIRIRGAVTDTVLKTLIDSGLRGLDITADDPSKIMTSPAVFEKCAVRGMRFFVADKPRLCAVAVNPFSAYGSDYESGMFLDEMRKRLDKLKIPVFNVKGETS